MRGGRLVVHGLDGEVECVYILVRLCVGVHVGVGVHVECVEGRWHDAEQIEKHRGVLCEHILVHIPRVRATHRREYKVRVRRREHGVRHFSSCVQCVCLHEWRIFTHM